MPADKDDLQVRKVKINDSGIISYKKVKGDIWASGYDERVQDKLGSMGLFGTYQVSFFPDKNGSSDAAYFLKVIPLGKTFSPKKTPKTPLYSIVGPEGISLPISEPSGKSKLHPFGIEWKVLKSSKGGEIHHLSAKSYCAYVEKLPNNKWRILSSSYNNSKIYNTLEELAKGVDHPWATKTRGD
jgi:hypothetical protein